MLAPLEDIDIDNFLTPDTFDWCQSRLLDLGFNGDQSLERDPMRPFFQIYLQLRQDIRDHIEGGNQGPTLALTAIPRGGVGRYNHTSLQDQASLQGDPLPAEIQDRLNDFDDEIEMLWGFILFRIVTVSFVVTSYRGRESRASLHTSHLAAFAHRRPPSPFPHCNRLLGHFGGCCGNCKWPDRSAPCSKRDEVENTWGRVAERISYEAAAVPLALPAGGSREADPIEVKDEADDDDEMDLVPNLYDGSAGASTAEDPLQLD
ncbi:hypothetical protein EDB80DRAFT_831108 [Ilyonectria destructans]|nr:hypothetical protein EDB80DRAFT_831108 [Ilyonectria destructans]